MISIHTNLSALVAQRNLKSSTDLLNQAIERMTTGFKINGAKDNAANYAIATDMTTKICSYDVAEDNVAVGITMIETANSLLAEINDRFERLNALQIQASNGTYGENSRNAINAEVNSLIDEINRLYQTAEYNGIKLFMETVEDENGNSYYEQESYADETTTLADLEISNSSFAVYSKNGNLIQEYELTEDNTLGEFLDTLESEGFNTTMLNGEISISSRDGKYIIGDL